MVIALLALLGAFVALYLTLYKFGVIGVLSCNIGSCESVNTSRWAIFMGLPVAAWGLGSYLLILVLSLAGLQGVAPRQTALATTAIATWGVLFSGWLSYLELFVIRAICMWCVISATLMLLLFLTSVVELRRELRAA